MKAVVSGNANHIFYMGSDRINSRVVTQKKIDFDPGKQGDIPKEWNFTYPTYQGRLW